VFEEQIKSPTRFFLVGLFALIEGKIFLKGKRK